MRQAEKPKLAPPPERRIIKRPRLLNQLEATDARTILLIAPAGYGKTTLARQWLAQRDGAWFTASLASADVAALARGLADSLAPFAPNLPRHVDETLRVMQPPARELDSLCEVFLSHLDKTTDLLLVIDDYHAVESSIPAQKLIESLVTRTKTLRVLIASRTRPRWATARKQIYGESFELRRDELALDGPETAEVLGHAPVNSSTAQEIIERANGWPAVLGLVAIAGAPGAPSREAIPQTLYDFLAQESFNGAEPATQDALLAIALMPQVTSSALTAAFGDERTVLVADAARTGLVDLSPSGVGVHPLARDFLFERLREVPDATSRVQASIANAIAQSTWDEALALMQAFHMPDQLEELMTASFRPLLASGRLKPSNGTNGMRRQSVEGRARCSTSSTPKSPFATDCSIKPRHWPLVPRINSQRTTP